MFKLWETFPANNTGMALPASVLAGSSLPDQGKPVLRNTYFSAAFSINLL
jgi:hypothetical protein